MFILLQDSDSYFYQKMFHHGLIDSLSVVSDGIPIKIFFFSLL